MIRKNIAWPKRRLQRNVYLAYTIRGTKSIMVGKEWKQKQEAERSQFSSACRDQRRQEVEWSCRPSNPAPSDVLPSRRRHSWRFHKLSQTAPPTGHHMFKHLSPWGTFFFQTTMGHVSWRVISFPDPFLFLLSCTSWLSWCELHCHALPTMMD